MGYLKVRRVPGGIRTPNLLIRSQLLYPVELQTRHPGIVRGLNRGRKKTWRPPKDAVIFSEDARAQTGNRVM